MFKTSKAVIAAALIVGSAATAFAAETYDVDLYRANPNLDPAYAIQDTRGAYAYAPRAQVRRTPTAVYENGHYVGQDPDASIRLQLQRETPPQ
jgi:hypothetical protein